MKIIRLLRLSGIGVIYSTESDRGGRGIGGK